MTKAFFFHFFYSNNWWNEILHLMDFYSAPRNWILGNQSEITQLFCNLYLFTLNKFKQVPEVPKRVLKLSERLNVYSILQNSIAKSKKCERVGRRIWVPEEDPKCGHLSSTAEMQLLKIMNRILQMTEEILTDTPEETDKRSGTKKLGNLAAHYPLVLTSFILKLKKTQSFAGKFY